MSDPERALPVLRRLHFAGAGCLAVDDFGPGTRRWPLRQLPVDECQDRPNLRASLGATVRDLAVVPVRSSSSPLVGLTCRGGRRRNAARISSSRFGLSTWRKGYLISRPLSQGAPCGVAAGSDRVGPGLRDEYRAHAGDTEHDPISGRVRMCIVVLAPRPLSSSVERLHGNAKF